MIDPKIFRDYDIRAVADEQLDTEGIKKITKAIIKLFSPKSVQVGRDMRVTSPEYQKAMVDTFLKYGVDVVDLGLTSTDMLYFAAGKFDEDMAINVSASHNPAEYNGLKMVKQDAVAISGDSGIYDIRDLACSEDDIHLEESDAQLTKRDIMRDWVNHLLTFVDVSKLRDFNLVIDTGNGMAGHFLPELEKKLPWKVTRLYYELDGTFPNHPASPIEPENMQDCVDKVLQTKADAGMAFDGDGDRVFLVDEKGRIVSGTIMTAIIAENLLEKNQGETVLYNAIVGRIVPEIVEKNGGKTERVRVGHTLIKEKMRELNAIFCGEHSGHYYFRDNYFADSAIIAALLVLEQMSIQGKKLSELLDNYDKYCVSGELNFEVEDKQLAMNKIEEKYKSEAESTDWLDGISVWFADWWFNVRPSNTEPLLRLNIEADDKNLLELKQKELVNFLKTQSS